MQRDKATLGNEIQALHNRVNEALMRISYLEGANSDLRNSLAAAASWSAVTGLRARAVAFRDAFSRAQPQMTASSPKVARRMAV